MPDVVLMDYVLSDGTGAQATRIAKARWPRARVLMLTAVDADETVLETVQAGADGYLTKARAVREVVAAIRSVHNGEILLTPARSTLCQKAEHLKLPPGQRCCQRRLGTALSHTLRDGGDAWVPPSRPICSSPSTPFGLTSRRSGAS